MSDARDEVTRVLQESAHRADAAEKLLPIVYDELRRIANRHMSDERTEHTLDATGLVHEAYLKLVGSENIPWANRAHFFSAAAEAMRRLLVDHARRHRSQKRGGGKRPVALEVADLADADDPTLVGAMDEAVTKLEAEDPQAGAVIRLRFYAGLSVEDAARMLDISPRTAAREWSFAKARLVTLLEESIS